MFERCQCESPMVKCNHLGCICQMCGLPENKTRARAPKPMTSPAKPETPKERPQPLEEIAEFLYRHGERSMIIRALKDYGDRCAEEMRERAASLGHEHISAAAIRALPLSTATAMESGNQ